VETGKLTGENKMTNEQLKIILDILPGASIGELRALEEYLCKMRWDLSKKEDKRLSDIKEGN